MSTYVLVSCGKEKLSHAAPAKDLYTSQLFRKSRAWAERSGHPWFILSAKHGLVSPDTVLEPYDEALTSMPMGQVREWGRSLASQLLSMARPGDRLIVLGGERYLSFVPFLPSSVVVDEPMKGMQIGQRLSWLTKQLSEPAARPVNRLCPVTWRT